MPLVGLQGKVKPWIVVGGVEASKGWLLLPRYPTKKTNRDRPASLLRSHLDNQYSEHPL